MSEHPEGFTPPDDDDDRDSDENPQPVHGQVRHSNLSARVPESVSSGVFSNGVMILTGAHEIVLDFVLRMGEQQRVVTRCVLPKPVAGQFLGALEENIRNYEHRFGGIPPMPKAREIDNENSNIAPTPPDEQSIDPARKSHPENLPIQSAQPQIQDIYDELKMSDETLAGRYANAVLIRHSATEFCFDFITNMFPRSAVSARVFLATPHIPPLVNSLRHALNPPGTNQGFA